MSYYREQLEAYLKTVDVVADTVFDVGGRQKPVQGRTKSWQVREYTILDLPEYNLDVPTDYGKQGDVVFCLEVFEYLLVPTVAMTNLNKLLKKDGIAYVSFPFIYPLHNEVEFDSLRYTHTGVNRLAAHAKFEVTANHFRKAKTGSLTKYYAEDGMRAAKGHNHAVTGFIVRLKKVGEL